MVVWPRVCLCILITAKTAPLVFGAAVLASFVPLACSLVAGSGEANLEPNFFTLNKE